MTSEPAPTEETPDPIPADQPYAPYAPYASTRPASRWGHTLIPIPIQRQDQDTTPRGSSRLPQA